MKRRQILTAAGALVGASLPGCGGGGETAGGEPSSEIAAWVIPATLVPENGHYQVEVVFGLQRGVGVWLTSGGRNVGFDQIASKSITTGWSHKVGFVKLRVTDEPQRDFQALGLYVNEHTKKADGTYNNWYHQCGFQTDTLASSSNVKYTYYPESGQHEWNFYSADPGLSSSSKKLFCSVRMFKLPIDQLYDFTGTYFRVIPNNAPIGNLGNLATIRSKHLETIFDIPSHESAARKTNGTHQDTIVLQDHQQPAGFRMLVPTLRHASTELRPMLERLLHRHLEALGKKQASVSPMDGVEDKDHSHLISNELLRLLGGESLVENMRNYREKMFAEVQSIFGSVTPDFAQHCQVNLSNVATPEMKAETTQMLVDAMNATAPDGNVQPHGYSFMNTISLQAQGSVTVSNWPFLGCDAGGGVRFVIPLFRTSTSRAKQAGVTTVHTPDNYNLVSAGNSTQYSAVGVIKLINAGSLLSIDIEFTINFSRIEGNVIVQSMVFDPVIDFDLRNLFGRLSQTAFKATAGALIDRSFAVMLNYTANTFNIGPLLLAQTGTAMLGMGGLPSSGFPEQYIKPLLDSLNATKDTRSDILFNVFEVSPLRFKFAHRDLGIVPFDANTPSWVWGANRHGWCPGVKSVFGYGFRVSGLLLDYYFRVVNTLDLGLVMGNEDFFEAQGLIING